MSTRSDCTEFGPFRLFPAERQLLKGRTPSRSAAASSTSSLRSSSAPEKSSPSESYLREFWPDVAVRREQPSCPCRRTSQGTCRWARSSALHRQRPGPRLLLSWPPLVGPSSRASFCWAGAPPQRLTRIIGRDNDISAIAALIAEHRFVTIHGPGGVGKTTLGLAIASAHAHAFADGVCFVDLSLNIGVHTVADTLASALELIARARDPLPSLSISSVPARCCWCSTVARPPSATPRPWPKA